jgi:uncharacterized protein (UPF0332 family)
MDDAERALRQAERLAQQAAELAPASFEAVIHLSYYAMFHAARAALLATEGSATTRHGRLPKAFAVMVRRTGREGGRRHAEAFQEAYDLRITSDYGFGERELSREAAELVAEVEGFVAFCRAVLRERDSTGGGTT